MDHSTFSCLHEESYCPISGKTCPGVCIYANILGTIDLGIILLDIAAQEILFLNSAAKEIIHKEIGEITYSEVSSLLKLHEEGNLTAKGPFLKTSFTMEDKTIGYTAYRPSARFIWLHIKDITQDIRLTSIAEAVTTMNNIGYIISGIRHELGNPINSTKMSLSVLKEKLKDGNYSLDDARVYIDRSLDQIERVEFLLKSLKTFNMYETPEVTELNIHGFVERFLKLLSHDFENRDIKISPHLHKNLTTVCADPRILQQVLLNIFTNAADALKDAEDPTIDLQIFTRDEIVNFNISDNGTGMSEEQLQKIFLPFVTSKEEGTGLGLVIVKKMLTYMNGTIDITSYQNIGTTVKITLPQAIT